MVVFGWSWNGFRGSFEGFSEGVWMGEETDNILSILATGVTGGVTNWGYIFEKVGLQNRGLRHTRALEGINTPFYAFFIGNLPLRSKSFWRLHLIIYSIWRIFVFILG